MPRRSGAGRPPAHARFRFLLLLATLPLIDGCARPGEFGRGGGLILPSLAAKDPLPTGSVPASNFPLSEDEKLLRDLARGIVVSPDEQGGSMLNVVEPGQEPDRAARYVDYLINGPFRSAAARYSKLVDDTRNDITRLEPFFMVARRIADLDMKRERSLGHVSKLKPEELLNAKRRVRENMLLIAETHRIMIKRTVMYRTALERLVITLPSPFAVEAERQRIELERRLAEIQVFSTPSGPPAQSAASDAPRQLVSK